MNRIPQLTLLIIIFFQLEVCFSEDPKPVDPPIPTATPTRTPCDPPAPPAVPGDDDSICEKARCTESVHKGDGGGIVCCDGVQVPCYLGENAEGSYPGSELHVNCTKEHEQHHIDSGLVASCIGVTGCPVRAPKSQISLEAYCAEECAAYLAEFNCWLNNVQEICLGFSGQDQCECIKNYNQMILQMIVIKFSGAASGQSPVDGSNLCDPCTNTPEEIPILATCTPTPVPTPTTNPTPTSDPKT